MAITYLSGERIQGSSTAEKTPAYSTTFGSTDSANWRTNQTHVKIVTASNRLEFECDDDSTNEYLNYDLQHSDALGSGNNVSDTAWILRYEMTFSTFNMSQADVNNALIVGCLDNSSPNSLVATGDGITYNIQVSDAAHSIANVLSAVDGGTQGKEDVNNDPFDKDDIGDYLTTFYVEIKRVNSTTIEQRVYTDSFGGTQLGTTMQNTESEVDTSTGLRYLTIQLNTGVHGSDGYTGYIQNLKFWNDQTTTVQDEKASITDVSVGTRYEETDTRKIFRRSAGDENVGTSGTGGDWAEVVFDDSTIANNAVATGNAVTRSSGSDWTSYIRSSTNKLSPATGGGEVYFTQTGTGNHSFGLEKTPFNSAPSAVHTGRDYSFHTTSASNNMYEDATSYSGTAYGGNSNEFRITMAANGAVVYYWRSGNSGSWTTERTSNVTASGDYYVTVSMGNTTSTVYCYIKSDANPTWKEKGTA